MPETQTQLEPDQIMERLILGGDLSALTPMQRVIYYGRVCSSLGLNPETKPFDIIELDGRLVMYARKDCTEQLRKIHNVTIRIIDHDVADGGIYIVTVEAELPTGRKDVDVGAVCLKGLVGKELANTRMKAVTKAKRRVTLSICGLGMLDESELDGIDQGRIGESQSLVIKGSGLDQWACSKGTAWRVLKICEKCESLGATVEDLKSYLPEGLESRKQLTEEQAEVFITALENRISLTPGGANA